MIYKIRLIYFTRKGLMTTLTLSVCCAVCFASFSLFSQENHAPNPNVSDIKTDEFIQFLPTLGNRAIDGSWQTDIHGFVFEKENRSMPVHLFESAIGLKIGELQPEEKEIFKERARLFLIDHERNKTVVIENKERRYRIGTSRPDGHFNGTIRFADSDADIQRRTGSSIFSYQAAINPVDSRIFSGKVFLLEKEGISIVSDIDDTIKISEVRDRTKLLRNTFARVFRPAPGMAAWYRKMEEKNASFHYVSASPWDLSPAILAFIQEEHFPEGSVHLKSFRWKDESFFNLLASPIEYKLGEIVPILQRFPLRKFILIGDSGEKDPEVYGEIARRFPAQILHIFIRDVTDETAAADRYVIAFRAVPPDMWEIFTDPSLNRNFL